MVAESSQRFIHQTFLGSSFYYRASAMNRDNCLCLLELTFRFPALDLDPTHQLCDLRLFTSSFCAFIFTSVMVH